MRLVYLTCLIIIIHLYSYIVGEGSSEGRVDATRAARRLLADLTFAKCQSNWTNWISQNVFNSVNLLRRLHLGSRHSKFQSGYNLRPRVHAFMLPEIFYFPPSL